MNALIELNRARDAYRKALQDAYLQIPLELKALGETVQPPTPMQTRTPAAPKGKPSRRPKTEYRGEDIDDAAKIIRDEHLDNNWKSSRSLAGQLNVDCGLALAACTQLVENGDAERKDNGAHPLFRRAR